MKERWVPVKEWEGLYEVSNLGKVRSLSRTICYADGRIYHKQGQLITPRPNNKRGGYLGVGLCKHSKAYDFQLHRLVASHFIPNPKNKPQVNHKNGFKADCRSKNLEWATAKENGEHAARTDLVGTRKISPKLAKRIKNWIRKTNPRYSREVSKKFGVTIGIVDGIRSGLCWNHL